MADRKDSFLLPGWMGHLYAQMPEPTPTVTLDMRQVPPVGYIDGA